jgi:hypothetical protein
MSRVILSCILLLIVSGAVASTLVATPVSPPVGEPEVTIEEHVPAVRSERSPAADGWGNIKGRIVYNAPAAPAPEQLKVTANPQQCLANGNLFSEDLLVNKNGMGVKNVFVWLIPAPPAMNLAIHPNLQKPPKNKVEMDQPCCMFVPHALCLREGDTLVAKNSSTIPHNFNWTGHPNKNPGNNQIIPAGGSIDINNLVGDLRSPVMIKCNIHGWMSGVVRVFDNPYYALTDADGKFEIKDAPAGPCNIVMWQEKKGWVVTQPMKSGRDGILIEVSAGKTLDLGDVKMDPPE